MNKMRISLAISLVLNIFLIGAVSGGAAWLNFGQRMILAGSLRVAGAELPEEQSRAFRQALRQARASEHDQVSKTRDARARAANLLRQPEVDQQALLGALDEARAADFAVRSAVEKRAVEFASSLSAEDRNRLADAIGERGRRAVRRNQ
jgi:uncharacterized membrane protein